MVDKSSSISFQCSINYQFIINPKHIATNAFAVVKLFSLITECVSNYLPCIFDNLKE